MNISKSLKEKNRISGRIAKLQQLVKNNNRFREDQVPELNSLDLLKELEIEQAFLIALKSKIAKANIGIVDKLVDLAESKSQLKFWSDFTSGAAEEVSVINKYVKGNYTEVDVKMISRITTKDIYEKRNLFQKRIEELQDEIDDFNATTQI